MISQKKKWMAHKFLYPKSGSRDLAFGLENLRMKALEVQGAMPCCFGSQTPAVVMATLRRRSIQMFFGTPNHVDVENICSKIIYYDILVHGGIILKLLISRTQQEVKRWCQHGAAAPGKAQRNRVSKQLKRGGLVFFRSQWQQEQQQLSTLDLGSKKNSKNYQGVPMWIRCLLSCFDGNPSGLSFIDSSCSSWGPSVVCWSIKPANCRFFPSRNHSRGWQIPHKLAFNWEHQ